MGFPDRGTSRRSAAYREPRSVNEQRETKVSLRNLLSFRRSADRSAASARRAGETRRRGVGLTVCNNFFGTRRFPVGYHSHVIQKAGAMNILRTVLFAAAIAGGSAIATDADARGRHHHHHHRHHGHVGIWFGAPLFYPYYAYPRYYYPPAVIAAPAAPPVYIEQSQSAAPAPAPAPMQGSAAYWYFCRDTQTYYPYVQQCATPWQQVVPNSAPPS